MLQRWVLYYHLTWLTSPPIGWDSIVWCYDHRMINTVSHKSMRESIEVEIGAYDFEGRRIIGLTRNLTYHIQMDIGGLLR
jgi:hypothetical protein